MQTALRTLVSAEEAYFETSYAYTTNLNDLEWDPTPLVTIQITEVSGNGWSAKATHQMTTIECGVYVGSGTAPPPGVPDSGNGVISCTSS
jgi:hypothetical protein